MKAIFILLIIIITLIASAVATFACFTEYDETKDNTTFLILKGLLIWDAAVLLGLIFQSQLL